MTSIRELADRHWEGEGDLVHEHHPVVPVNNRGAEELDDGVLYVKSIASVLAVLAAPTSREAHEVRAEVYRARSAQQDSSMARNILGHAALSSEEGLRDHAGRY